MKVRLKRDFYCDGVLYQVNRNPDGMEMPDDTILPKDAEIWDGKKWVKAYDKEGKAYDPAPSLIASPPAPEKKSDDGKGKPTLKL